MSRSDELLNRTAARIGLRDPDLLGKAIEYERLSKLKITAGNISDIARAAICLDLAAAHHRLPFDMESALNLCNIKKKMYSNHKNNIAKLLNIAQDVSVDNLCVRMGCPDMGTFAAQSLSKFLNKTVQVSEIIDLQQGCMAIYQACKYHKVKLPKSIFLSISNLNVASWKVLETNWNDKMKNSKDNFKKKDDVAKMDKINDDLKEQKNIEHESDSVTEIESYESWKKRILEQAFKEVNLPASLLSKKM